MLLTAWCTCALLAVAAARVYTRCELADELSSLGVRKDDIATWVCIAFHESQMNTAAHNQYSGDHGLLQISQLYWCGPGKACGLTCADLRNEDIADDVRCALQIHEEHTRIQGDGFLAWVVYPQHCRHNVKKYLVDCDGSLKSVDKSRSEFVFGNSNDTGFDQAKTPYLKIKSIFRSGYQNLNVIGNNSTSPYRWLDFKISDIDSLKLPVFQKIQNLPATSSYQPTTAKPLTTKSYATIIRTTHTTARPTYSEFTTRYAPVTNKIYSTTIRPLYDGLYTKNKLINFVNTPKTSTKYPSSLLTTKPTIKFTGFPSKSVYTNRPTVFPSKYSSAITPRTTPATVNYNNAFIRKSVDLTTKHFPTAITTRANSIFSTKRSFPDHFDNKSTLRIRNPITFSYFGTTTRSPAFFNNTPKRQSPAATAASRSTTRINKIDSPKSTTKFNIFDFYLNRKPASSSSSSFGSHQENGSGVSAFGVTTPSWKYQRADQKTPKGGAGRNQFRRDTEQLND